METIEVERAEGHRHHHPEPAGEEERHQRADVGRAAGDVPRHRRPRRRPRRRAHRRRWRVLLGRRPERRERRRRASAATSGTPCATSATSCLALHRMPQPVIAKVGGVAAGAGCNMALGCDLIVASDEARFSEIFARRGLSIDFGGSWLLPRLVGLHRAKELALLRRHHLGQGGRGHGAREPGRARRRARRLRRRLGQRAWPPGRRSPWPRPSGCSTTASRSRWSRRSRTRAGPRR